MTTPPARPRANGTSAAVDRVAPWLLLGLTLVFYAPILFARATFPPGDFLHHFFPFSLVQHTAWLAGELPVWNPYTYGGHPFLADVQAAVYYPVSSLLLLLTLPVADPGWRLYILHLDAVLHTWLGGLFLYWLGRDLTRNTWAGLAGGVAFALSGYLTGYAPLQLAVLRTAIWLPLLWWGLAHAWQSPNRLRWWLVTAGAVAAAILAGHSQTLLLTVYATIAWVAHLALAVRPRDGLTRARWLGLTGAAVVSVAVTTAQWWPSWEFVRSSVRAAADYAFAAGGFPWRDLWQLLLPGVLTEYSPLYIGASGVLMALVAIFAATTRPRRLDDNTTLPGALLPWRRTVFCLAFVAAFGLLASTGGNGPLYPLLYRFAPGWGLFRGQERAAFLVVVALSLLAAYGCALAPRLPCGVGRRAATLGGALIVALIYAFGLLWQLPGRTAVNHVTYLIIAAVTLVFAMSAAVVFFVPGWRSQRGALLVGVIALNLLWTNAGTNLAWGTPWARVTATPEIAAVQAAVRGDSGSDASLPGRVYNEYRAYDDYGMAAGVEDVWGSSPLRLAAYDALFREFPLDRMWRLLGVEHVLTWRRELFGPSELLGEWPQVTDTTYLHRLPDANPRAWLATTVIAAPDDATLTGLANHQISLDQVAWVAQDAGITAADLRPADAAIRIARVSSRSFALSVASSGGLLVVAENWLSGWRIVNAVCGAAACPVADDAGRPYLTPVRADLTLIGVWLPPGAVSFRLEYHPASVFVGLWISLATAALVMFAIAWRLAMRRTQRP